MLDKRESQDTKNSSGKSQDPQHRGFQTGWTAPSAVLERIRKMENQGIIDGYEVRLNPRRFSRNQIAFINVECNCSHDQDDTVGRALAAIEEVQEVHYVAGNDVYLVKIRVADIEELNSVLRSKILTITGVRGTKTMPAMATYKETAKISIR